MVFKILHTILEEINNNFSFVIEETQRIVEDWANKFILYSLKYTFHARIKSMLG